VERAECEIVNDAQDNRCIRCIYLLWEINMKFRNGVIILFILLLASCNKDIIKRFINDFNENLTNEEAVKQSEIYWAIDFKDVEKVREYLEEGYDPNKSRGEQGFRDSTPLNIIAKSFYDTYVRMVSEKEIPDPTPDIIIFNLLVNAGADVNNRPYIWCRVDAWNNYYLESMYNRKTLLRVGREPNSIEEIEEFNNEKIIEPIYFINDANRLIKAFLEAGADPDMRGHPYPYSREAGRSITAKEADKYFAKGTRPINEAIKKGIRWESQVDLLLQYTTLDKDSLKAAKKSKDPATIEKINKLWKEQNSFN